MQDNAYGLRSSSSPQKHVTFATNLTLNSRHNPDTVETTAQTNLNLNSLHTLQEMSSKTKPTVAQLKELKQLGDLKSKRDQF
jgi:hypothetical protein